MSAPDPGIGSWNDKLTIETPEQTALEFPLAGVGSRCLALLLDTLIQTGVLLVLLIGFLALAAYVPSTVSWASTVGIWAYAIFYLIFFVIYFGYFAIFECVWNGQTPGKRVAHLRVIQESGRPILIWQGIARNLLRAVDQLPAFYAVGLTSALISKQNRRLGDFVAGTVVVHERPLAKISVGWANAPPTTIPGIPLGAARLGTEEVRLIEAFLERRDSLDWDVRRRMASQIAFRVGQAIGLADGRRAEAGLSSDESFLEAVARERIGTRSR
ncbi:MAG TPA: RDD family protein [Candidatus Acidoferrales bacterium]|jgi:uncharacterized RDD family membrane protein YckC|nr:RDD family protein [Candidatus Acidoferrales bacterium]